MGIGDFLDQLADSQYQKEKDQADQDKQSSQQARSPTSAADSLASKQMYVNQYGQEQQDNAVPHIDTPSVPSRMPASADETPVDYDAANAAGISDQQLQKYSPDVQKRIIQNAAAKSQLRKLANNGGNY